MNDQYEVVTTKDQDVSPLIRLASSLNHCRNEAAYLTSARDSCIGLPHSNVMIVASASRFDNMLSDAARRRSLRTLHGVNLKKMVDNTPFHLINTGFLLSNRKKSSQN